MWLPSSPDCNHLDFRIWGVVESRACATAHLNVDALKASVDREWAAMSEDYVIKTCKAFRPSIEAMIPADDDHFELLNFKLFNKRA